MFLPFNGRVAIMDNEPKEVQPLLNIFSKHRIPSTFFNTSDSDFIPEETDETNDIRLLFLDLNFLDKTTHDVKNVKSSLHGYLKRVISRNNFPYLIILWSTQEKSYQSVVKELFENELKDRRPIGIENFIKSDYIDHEGNVINNGDENLINKVSEILQKYKAHNILVYWENKVHKAADSTLQNIFSSYDGEAWENKTNYIIDKLSEAYLGYTNHASADFVKRTKGALQGFNNIFYDTLEAQINILSKISDQEKLTYRENEIDNPKDVLGSLNFKLIASKSELEEIDYTGIIVEDTNERSRGIFETIFQFVIDKDSFARLLIEENPNYDSLTANPKKTKASELRKKIRKKSKRIYLVVTPLCDKVQNKYPYIRILKGFLFESKYKDLIQTTSEAIYTSPTFFIEDENTSYFLVLDYRHLFTFKNDQQIIKSIKNIQPIFRLRSPIVADIQSKLARHISRQGVLYTV